jgi:hypothetical protein
MLFQIYEQELQKKPHSIVRGSREQRLYTAIEAIDRLD